MVLIFGLIVFILLPAFLAAGLMTLLSMWATSLSQRRRVVIASLVSAFVIIAVPVAALLARFDSNAGPGAALVAVLVFGLLIAALVCLPSALWVGRRIERKRVKPETFH